MENISVEINKYIMLLLEENKCKIYILNEKFMEFDISKLKETIQKYRLSQYFNVNQENAININQDELKINDFVLISKIFKFWVNHNYNTNFLDYHISFPLLRKLVQLGDKQAKKVFYNEIIMHLWGGDPLFVKFLIRERYDEYVELESFKRKIHTPNIFNDIKGTLFLCFLLLVVHIILEIYEVIEWFDLDGTRIFEHYEIWRFFTSMFTHHVRIHLLVNICLILIFGSIFEVNNLFSYRAYIIIYLVSGLVGNIFFFLLPFDLRFLPTDVTLKGAGASGCAFGLMGAIIIILLKKKRFFWTAILILIVGFFLIQSLDPRLNFTAHFFGLLAGLIVNSLINAYDSHKQNKKYVIKKSP